MIIEYYHICADLTGSYPNTKEKQHPHTHHTNTSKSRSKHCIGCQSDCRLKPCQSSSSVGSIDLPVARSLWSTGNYRFNDPGISTLVTAAGESKPPAVSHTFACWKMTIFSDTWRYLSHGHRVSVHMGHRSCGISIPVVKPKGRGIRAWALKRHGTQMPPSWMCSWG